VKVVQVRNRTKGGRRITGAEIDKRICAHFRRKEAVRLREMTRAWKPIPYLDERRRIIREALSAHVDRKYSLSIAALLPLVDGLAAEIRRTTIKPAKGKKLKLIAVNEVVHLYRPADGRSRKWAEVVSIAVTEGIFKDYDFNTQPAPAKNNRHGVLHGRIPNYESEKLSLQTFLVLDVMACIAAKHP
jgi:hypothetical protein